MIDWTQPLELMDGTPVRLSKTGYCGGPNPDSDGDYWVEREDGARSRNPSVPGRCVSADGTRAGVPYVRNRGAIAAQWRYTSPGFSIACYDHEQLLRLVERSLDGEVTFEPITKGNLTHRVRVDGDVAGYLERVS